MTYDYLIVGAGLFGAVFAHQATQKGKKCLVIDRRSHIGGNIYCETIEDIRVHTYGAHIFSYLRQRGVGLCKSIRFFQPLYQFPCCNL